VYGQRQYVTTANTTMGACALYTLTVGKGKKGGSSTAGVYYEALPIDTVDLENTLGWRLLMKHTNLTDEEKQRIMQSAAMPPVLYSGLMYSHRSVGKLTKERWRPRGDDFDASEAVRFVADPGSGSRPTEAAGSDSRAQVFPEGAADAPCFPWDHMQPTVDYLAEDWWFAHWLAWSEEARLTPWLWLDLLNNCMSLPRSTSWVDHILFYPPPGKSARPIPWTYSLRSLQGLTAEKNQKRPGDPRWDFLNDIFIPHIAEKRWELQYWRLEELAALDKMTEAEAAQRGTSSSSRAAPKALAAKRRGRASPLGSTSGRPTGLRWVPKGELQCAQGTSVPEAQEVSAERDFKFGPKDILDPRDCDRLRE